jgi:hypothetical protein
MARSTELRWFVQGNPTFGFEAWFHSNNAFPAEVEPGRTDQYLALRENESASLKLRNGKLELKVQVSAARVHRWGELAGKIDIWEKWVVETEADARIRGSGRWIPIEKDRQLRRYREGAAGFEEVEPGTLIENGFKAEFCRLKLQLEPGRPVEPWWTFSLEGFGDRRALSDGAAWFFGRKPSPIRLTAAMSRSYPSWLAWLAFPFRPIP